MVKGIAIRITSIGIFTMYSPLRENITTMVNNNAMSVKGLILGTNLVSYHCLLLILISIKRVKNPDINGIPR